MTSSQDQCQKTPTFNKNIKNPSFLKAKYTKNVQKVSCRILIEKKITLSGRGYISVYRTMDEWDK